MTRPPLIDLAQQRAADRAGGIAPPGATGPFQYEGLLPVKVNDPQANDAIVWDSTLRRWVNRPVVVGGDAGGTVQRFIQALGDQIVKTNAAPPGLPYLAATTLTRVDVVVEDPGPTGSGYVSQIRQGDRVLATATVPAGETTATVTGLARLIEAVATGGPVQVDVTAIGSGTEPGSFPVWVLTTDASVTPVEPDPDEDPPPPPAVIFASGGALDASRWYDPSPNAYQYTLTYPSDTSESVGAPPSGSPGNYFQQIAKDAILPGTTHDAELTCRLDLTNKVPTNSGWWFGPVMRAAFLAPPDDQYTTFEKLAIGWDGTNWTPYLGTDAGPAAGGGLPAVAGASKVLRVRFRVQGTTISAKVWAEGAAEPSGWGGTYQSADRPGLIGLSAEYEPDSGVVVVSDLRVTAL